MWLYIYIERERERERERVITMKITTYLNEQYFRLTSLSVYVVLFVIYIY